MLTIVQLNAMLIDLEQMQHVAPNMGGEQFLAMIPILSSLIVMVVRYTWIYRSLIDPTQKTIPITQPELDQAATMPNNPVTSIPQGYRESIRVPLFQSDYDNLQAIWNSITIKYLPVVQTSPVNQMVIQILDTYKRKSLEKAILESNLDGYTTFKALIHTAIHLNMAIAQKSPWINWWFAEFIGKASFIVGHVDTVLWDLQELPASPITVTDILQLWF